MSRDVETYLVDLSHFPDLYANFFARQFYPYKQGEPDLYRFHVRVDTSS